MRNFSNAAVKKNLSVEEQFSLFSLADSLQDHSYFLTIMIFELIKPTDICKIKEKYMEESPKLQENGPLFKILRSCKRPHNNNKMPSEKNTAVFPL